MNRILVEYWPVLLISLIGVIVMVALSTYARSARQDRELKFRWHYLFVWPLIIDWLQKDPKRAGVLFTKRELIGWAIVILIVVIAIIINPARGS